MHNLSYTQPMTHVTRTATIQARVMPMIKEASERVLWRIGLTMSEAVELFLRRIIVDERIPFDIVALNGSFVSGIHPADQIGNTKSEVRTNPGKVTPLKKKEFETLSGRVFASAKRPRSSRKNG